jgi:hypothetical protein
MKKALVIACIAVLGLGAAAFAGPLSGSWCVALGFTDDMAEDVNVLALALFESVLTVDYTVCGWTFGSTAIFSKYAFDNVFFEAEGSVGAFGFYAGVDFYPQSVSFVNAVGAVDVSIAGVTFYGIGVIHNHNYKTSTTVATGVGFLAGAYGVAGDCSIWVESAWNMSGKISKVYANGWDWVVDSLFDYDWCFGWSKGLTTTQSTCCACWSSLDIYVEYSFACFDLVTKIQFDCTNGFDYACFEIDDICLGLGWLEIDDLNICFRTDQKSICGDIDLVLSDCICFTPYLAIATHGDHWFQLDGIDLHALTVEWDMGQGVVFKAGEIFQTEKPIDNNTWDKTMDCVDYIKYYCFRPDGSLVTYGDAAAVANKLAYDADTMCCYNVDYDEFFGLWIDGDACCGGAFSVSVINWFDMGDSDAIFDWQETVASLEIGIGSNTTLGLGVSVTAEGLNTLIVSSCFEW